MRLSFIIPVYNEEERIVRCLESILNQDMLPYEIILINDCSTDGTEQIITEYQSKYPFITCIHNMENMGAGECRNCGLDIAHGDYVWFVDGDDMITEGAIKELDAWIGKQKPPVDLLFFDTIRKTEMGETVNIFCESIAENIIYEGKEFYRLISRMRTIRAGVCGQICYVPFLKNNQIRFPEGTMAEDAPFSLKADLMADKVAYYRKAFYVYHRSTDSVSTTTSHKDYFLGTFHAFVEMYLFWEQGNWDRELDALVAKYVMVYLSQAREHWRLENHEEIEQWMLKHNLLMLRYYHMYIQARNTTSYIQKIPERVRKELEKVDEIMVYGAGNVARDFLQLFAPMGKRIIAYIVSDQAMYNPCAIYGVPVKKISEMGDADPNVLVVIAMMPDKVPAVVRTLQQHHYHNWIPLME